MDKILEIENYWPDIVEIKTEMGDLLDPLTGKEMEEGVIVTLNVLKPHMGMMITFTRKTLLNDIVKACEPAIKDIEQNCGSGVVSVVESALRHINVEVNKYFLGGASPTIH